jgi:hypothetical protein
MYRNHAAREDTIVFPARKTHFSKKQIEHKMFGEDGFDAAVEKIAAIETRWGGRSEPVHRAASAQSLGERCSKATIHVGRQ